MVTAASGLSRAVVIGCVLFPVTALPAVAQAADPKPAASTGAAVADPVTGLYPGQYVPATATSPAKAGWVTGTKTYDTNVVSAPVAAARPAAAARPVRAHAAPAAPAALPAALPFTSGEVTTGGRVASTRSSRLTAGQPTSLPFTGPTRLPLELSFAGALLLLGGLLQRAGRTRPALFP